MPEYCYKCGRVHNDMGTAGCPSSDPIVAPVYNPKAVPTVDLGAMRAEIAALRAENERLRDGLGKVAECLQKISFGPWRDLGLESITNIRDYAHTNTIIARAALSEKED